MGSYPYPSGTQWPCNRV